MSDTDTTSGLLPALLAFQAEAPKLPKDGVNPHFKSRFTKLDTIAETVRPLLNKHGLVWSTKPTRDEHGDPALHYRIAHAPSGESDEGTMPLLLVKQDPQAQGSAITYARRYAICAVLDLVADDDDDGNSASAPAPLGQRNATSPQKSGIKRRITQQKLNEYEARMLLDVSGVELGDGVSVNDAIAGLSFEQASAILDTLSEGVIPTGGSDVPSDDPPAHPPEQDPLPEREA